jgi:hypothetical protein
MNLILKSAAVLANQKLFMTTTAWHDEDVQLKKVLLCTSLLPPQSKSDSRSEEMRIFFYLRSLAIFTPGFHHVVSSSTPVGLRTSRTSTADIIDRSAIDDVFYLSHDNSEGI